MDFGENLQQLRKQKGLSQEKLAEILEVSRQAISKWELNAAYPETEKLITLSNLFGVSIDYLIKGSQDGKADESQTDLPINKTDESQQISSLTEHLGAVHSYRSLCTALAVILYIVSPFWFYLLGEVPGGSGKGVFLMLLSIAIATALLLYNHFTRERVGDKKWN